MQHVDRYRTKKGGTAPLALSLLSLSGIGLGQSPQKTPAPEQVVFKVPNCDAYPAFMCVAHSPETSRSPRAHQYINLFLNGVLNQDFESAQSASRLANVLGGDVYRVHNDTDGLASDLVKSAIGRESDNLGRLVEPSAAAVCEAFGRIHQLSPNAKVRLFSHSQGAIVLESCLSGIRKLPAFSALNDDEWRTTVASKFEIFTLGGANTLFSVEGVNAFVFDSDAVAQGARFDDTARRSSNFPNKFPAIVTSLPGGGHAAQTYISQLGEFELLSLSRKSPTNETFAQNVLRLFQEGAYGPGFYESLIDGLVSRMTSAKSLKAVERFYTALAAIKNATNESGQIAGVQLDKKTLDTLNRLKGTAGTGNSTPTSAPLPSLPTLTAPQPQPAPHDAASSQSDSAAADLRAEQRHSESQAAERKTRQQAILAESRDKQQSALRNQRREQQTDQNARTERTQQGIAAEVKDKQRAPEGSSILRGEIARSDSEADRQRAQGARRFSEGLQRTLTDSLARQEKRRAEAVEEQKRKEEMAKQAAIAYFTGGAGLAGMAAGAASGESSTPSPKPTSAKTTQPTQAPVTNVQVQVITPPAPATGKEGILEGGKTVLDGVGAMWRGAQRYWNSWFGNKKPEPSQNQPAPHGGEIILHD